MCTVGYLPELASPAPPPLPPPPLPSPPPDSFSLWKSEIIPLLNRSFRRGRRCKIPSVASGLCLSWGCTRESEQSSASGISPHFVATAFPAGHQITFDTGSSAVANPGRFQCPSWTHHLLVLPSPPIQPPHNLFCLLS